MNSNLIQLYFEADHDRLDSLFKEFQKLKGSSFPEAKQYFKAFFTGLKRHIVWEEEVLFPFFEQQSGMSQGGPTFVMREEHRIIGALLEQIHQKVRKGDTSSDAEEAKLVETLGAHNLKEENVLYPLIDRNGNEREAAAIFLAMENIPAERYLSCCGAHH